MLYKIKWADIKGYKGLYQVSSTGKVRSVSRRGWNGRVFHEIKGRELKLQSNGNYLKVSLSKKGKVKQLLVHRLVAQAFIDNPENKPEVNHINYNKHNNAVENLEWVTAKENDTHKRGRYTK